ncbi:MAG: phospholipid carrier-dependent glycosyltransferase [Sphingomonadales bacterium]|nr:phospholipid carrier-dependent glycosyltransferase [Sphingomonadales bacterium]MDE2568175.1 phospholipid carrier-dependent glycosyltransferase [Sphingomonadales bacterium]
MIERPAPAPSQRDPIPWVVGIVAVFFLVTLNRLGTPSMPMFDEIHYLPAARRLIDLTARLNPEHPLVGKEFIALGMMLFGDNAWGWRLPNAVLGAVGLFGAIRALWWTSRSRAATILFGVLFASNFVWFMIARIAMLDMAMGAFFALAVWQWVLAWQRPEKGRRHLVLTGVFMGLSLGAKWNAAPLMILPGLLFTWDRLWALKGRRKLALPFARGVGPVPGVSLAEAFVWLGVLPLAVYFATFLPAFFYAQDPMTLKGLVPFQRYMLQLQDSVVKPHTYMSRWWQWVFNIRPIWFLYQDIDGGQRGVLMVGNPFTMLAVLPALALCLWDGLRGDRLRLGVVLLYTFAVGFWALNGKPVQFYYHYMLAAGFAIAALALVLGEWWEGGLRWPARVSVGLALGLFALFYPIISAATLPAPDSFTTYTWLKSWR